MQHLLVWQVLVEMIGALGHAAAMARNGLEAVELVEQIIAAEHAAFDVVLMDCNMPVMDGSRTRALA